MILHRNLRQTVPELDSPFTPRVGFSRFGRFSLFLRLLRRLLCVLFIRLGILVALALLCCD